jgi:hypothetical protein
MNVEIGAEATLFPEKEYINGIAVAVLNTPKGKAALEYLFPLAVGFFKGRTQVPQSLCRSACVSALVSSRSCQAERP